MYEELRADIEDILINEYGYDVMYEIKDAIVKPCSVNPSRPHDIEIPRTVDNKIAIRKLYRHSKDYETVIVEFEISKKKGRLYY